jgi:hypothetical protein
MPATATASDRARELVVAQLGSAIGCYPAYDYLRHLPGLPDGEPLPTPQRDGTS